MAQRLTATPGARLRRPFRRFQSGCRSAKSTTRSKRASQRRRDKPRLPCSSPNSRPRPPTRAYALPPVCAPQRPPCSRRLGGPDGPALRRDSDRENWRQRAPKAIAPSAGDGAHFPLMLSPERALLGATHTSSWARGGVQSPHPKLSLLMENRDRRRGRHYEAMALARLRLGRRGAARAPRDAPGSAPPR